MSCRNWRQPWVVTGNSFDVYVLFKILTDGDLRDFVIEVLSSNKSLAAVCAEVTAPLQRNERRHIGCRLGSMGRLVRLRMTGTKPRPLTLCEVEVYGSVYFCLISNHNFVVNHGYLACLIYVCRLHVVASGFQRISEVSLIRNNFYICSGGIHYRLYSMIC